MGKRTKFKLDVKGFQTLAVRLDGLGGDLEEFFTVQLEQVAETVAEDTTEAVRASNLPAGGKYSKGNTEKSIIRNSKAEWTGNIGSIALGFDYAKPGAGGFLITGTPKMRPDYKLETIYARKTYFRNLSQGLENALEDEVKRHLKGG